MDSTGIRRLQGGNLAIQTNTPTNEYEALVYDCLRIMTRFTQARRAHLLFLTNNSKYPKDLYSWAGDSPSSSEPSAAIPARLDSKWWLHTLRANPVLKIQPVSALPDEVAADRDALLARGIEKLILLPVFDGKRLVATVCIDDPHLVQDLSEPQRDLLQIAAQLVVKVLFVSYDMAMLKRERAQLVYQNLHDDDTGLPNNTLFIERVKTAFERNDRLFAVLLVDFDYYQLIHERFGLEAGKGLVLAAVNVLRSNLRTTDMIARIDENQFGILIEGLHESGIAETVAMRILEQLKEPFEIEGQRVNISASIGIAMRNGHQRTPELVLQEAGIALLQAHQSGRNQYLLFNLAMRDHLIQRMEMESDLRGSLDYHQLVLHYQPISELATGRLIGFEALVRWMHPTRGLIWPSDFIALSEETGLIVPLGQWVLHEACRQMCIWQRRFPIDPPLTISVNISPRQLEQLDFTRQVARILQETGLPPTSLRLEITESTLIHRTPAAVSALNELRNLGVQLYIDDFGTGYSSLGYLHSLPIDAIKIDRTFVSSLGQAKSSTGVVQAIIQLARELNIEVVAEGVETSEQHSELRRMHCNFMQGFFISEPLEPGRVEGFITTGKGSPGLPYSQPYG